MNLPNKLTLFRILLVPAIILVWLTGNPNISFNLLSSHIILSRFICALLFIVASITDLLDGQIARRNNLVTTFGKFMDPIADKMLVNTILILLACDHLIPVLCVILMIIRDLIVDGIRLLAAQKQIVIAAGPLGKLKTILQMIAIPVVMVDNFPAGWLPFNVGLIFMLAATIVSVVSGYDYFMKNKEMIFESI